MAIAPIVALVSLCDDPSSASLVLTVIGLAIVIVGVYIVSKVWKEPHYDVMLAWDPEARLGGEFARRVTAPLARQRGPHPPGRRRAPGQRPH